jgi:hypothetical protein
MNVWYAPQTIEVLFLCVCMSEISGDELHGKMTQICNDRLYCNGIW